MSGNQCVACGQWSGKGHTCPQSKAVSVMTRPSIPETVTKAHPVAHARNSIGDVFRAIDARASEVTIAGTRGVRRQVAIRKEGYRVLEASRTLLNPFKRSYRKSLRRALESQYGPIDWSTPAEPPEGFPLRMRPRSR